MSTDNTIITASAGAPTIGIESNIPLSSTPKNPWINQWLQKAQDGTDDGADSPPAKHSKYVKLTPAQFEHIMNTCASQQDFISKFTTASPSSILHSQYHQSSTPAYYNNAKYEEISCRYDELEDQL